MMGNIKVLQKKMVVLISGRGSNMQALVEANVKGAEVVAVVSNKENAAGLSFAKQRGIAIHIVPHQGFTSRKAYDQALLEVVAQYEPDLVVLAGFMRVLGREFCEYFNGRLLNIHPSLLPAFQGLNTHQRALDSGAKVAGCTVHFVTPELDSGPIVAQGLVTVESDDTAETLAAKVLKLEHKLLPKVVEHYVAGSLRVRGHWVEGGFLLHELNEVKTP